MTASHAQMGRTHQSLAKSTCTVRHRTRSVRRRSLVPVLPVQFFRCRCPIVLRPMPISDAHTADESMKMHEADTTFRLFSHCRYFSHRFGIDIETAASATLSLACDRLRNARQSRGLICGGDAQLCGVAVVSKVEPLGLGGIDSTCLYSSAPNTTNDR